MMNKKQMEATELAMINWLADPEELGKAPAKIECVDEFDLHDLHYYVFRFKKGVFSNWLVGVCGGYEENSYDHCGHVYSQMDKYDRQTAVDLCIEMVEKIRAYWMQEAQRQQLQEAFERNLKFISQTEIDVDVIERQFVKSESFFYLTVGKIDCPTGRLIVSDPLCYLPTNRFSPELDITIPVGTYLVEVSIFRNSIVGIRMCTARLKIKDTKAIRYVRAMPTVKTANANGKDGILSGFPVDAGMMGFCDVQVADEYRAFLEQWHQENPGKNHYDDYFAKYFAQSEKELPAYQREGGDFIEWANPQTGHKMVMIASGFGDGFYQCYWGYDENNEICECIVPMVNPELFQDL